MRHRSRLLKGHYLKEKRTQREPELISIRRLCQANMQNYYWQVELTRDGKKFRKKFSDVRCGGERAALKLAQAWRDKTIAEHPTMSLAQYCEIPRKHNTSGVPGVFLGKTTKRYKSGRVAVFYEWVAKIPLGDKKVRMVRFSVNLYGSEEAKKRATAARQQGIAELDGKIIQNSPQPKAVSNQKDLARLEAVLCDSLERHAEIVAERQAIAVRQVQRAAIKLARAQAAPPPAQKKTGASGEPYIYPRRNAKGDVTAWLFQFSRLGEKHQKTFFCAHYGGVESTLARVVQWRDEFLYILPSISKAEVVQRTIPNNISGVLGVYPRYRKGKSRQITAWIACAAHKSADSVHRKRFSVAKYGENGSFALAVKAREAFVAELNDQRHLPLHVAKQAAQATGGPFSCQIGFKMDPTPPIGSN